jgi:hypothetical protein
MVVLKTLLSFDRISWNVSKIAKGFLNYYLDHPEHLSDYDELAKQENPEEISLQRVERHIMNMPLNYLSNKSKDWFILDRGQGVFSVKEDLVDYWSKAFYRQLILDRVDYALARYFYRKTT